MDAVAWGATAQARLTAWASGRRRAAAGAALLALLAGLLHLSIAPQHLEHLGHGLFLALAGVTQVAWGVAFWRNPSAALLRLGVVLAGTLIALWAITRVLPAPFGHSGPEEIEVFGVLSKVAEGLTLTVLLAMVFAGARSQETINRIRRRFLALLMVAGIAAFFLYGGGLAAERAFPWLGDEEEENLLEQAGLLATAPAVPLAGSAASSAPSAPEAGPAVAAVQELLPMGELMTLLGRKANGPAQTSLDTLYLPPVLARWGNAELFQDSQLQPTALFLMEHADHENCDLPDLDLLKPLLRLDSGEAVKPYEVTVLREDNDTRTLRYLFPLPQGTDPELLYQEQHTLTIIVPLGSKGQSTMTWHLPLQLFKEAAQPTNEQP